MIFQEYIHMGNSPDMLQHPRRWLNIMHVCHDWRVVVLHLAVLWSNFTVGELDVTREFLSRSKSAPLTIKVHPNAKLEPIREIFNSFARIRDIELGISRRDYLALESHFPEEAPILRRIVLQYQGPLGLRTGIPLQTYLDLSSRSFPGVFRRCSLPSLTNLFVEGYVPEWQHHIFASTLTSLTVHSIPKHRDGLRNMLGALNKMKDLRLLDVSFDCHPLDLLTRRPHSAGQVSLPKLEHLALRDSTESCICLLEALIFPPTVTILVTVTEQRPASSLPLLSAATFNKLSVVGAPQIASVALLAHPYWEPDDMTHLVFWDKVLDTKDIQTNPMKPLFHLQIVDMRDPVEVLKMGVSLGPLSDTQVLYIGASIDFDDDPWEPIKASMPNVHTLHTLQLDLLALEKLLKRGILHKSKRTSQTRPFFPMLDTLVLERGDFNYSVDGCLEAGLSARKLSGRPIRVLKLVDCSDLDEQKVDKLRGLVDEVIWDGKIRWSHVELMPSFDPPTYYTSEEEYLEHESDDHDSEFGHVDFVQDDSEDPEAIVFECGFGRLT